MAKLDRIATQPVALNNASESFKMEIALDLPENIEIVSGTGLVVAAVQIEARITVQGFSKIPVRGINTAYGYHITPEYIDLSISGTEKILAKLIAETDIQVTVDRDVLRITGRRHNPIQDPERRVHQMEVDFGPFERMLRIRTPIVAEEIRAVYRDGLLQIRMPKA